MIRTVTPLAAMLALCAAANAQFIRGHIGRPAAMPAGVIPTPSLPFPGAPGAPSPTPPPRYLPRPYLGNAFNDRWGYSPYWPVWYDSDPMPEATYTPAPASAPVYVIVPQAPAAPPQPVELRATLNLTVPMRAHVTVGGKEVDAKVSPLILESPVLQAGQSYTFDVKVTWPSGDRTEERTRRVSVDAGDSKSLKYFQ
jgi:uncharacterized protein (TIGR03000 family)